MKQAPVAVVLADDHPLMRKGLKDAIEEEGTFVVVAEAGKGDRALELIRQHTPSIAVLDIDMPGMTGLEVAAALQKARSTTSIIFLTMYDTATMFHRAMDLGVLGYVLKDSALTDIVTALETVAGGRHYVSPVLSGMALRHGNERGTADAVLGLSKLTSAERRILSLISQNKSTKEIADELSVSTRTVDTHRSNICSKLELRGTNALLRFALEHRDKL